MFDSVLTCPNVQFAYAETYMPTTAEYYILLPILVEDGLYKAMYITNEGEIVEPGMRSCTAQGAVAKLKAYIHECMDYAVTNRVLTPSLL